MKLTAMFAALALVFLGACTPSTPATPGATPAPTGVAAIGCSVEQIITSAAASAVASQLSCTNLSAVQGDMMGVLGGANFCAAVAPQASSVQAADAAKGVKAKGIVGSIVCPLALDAIMGLATSALPTTWGCKPGATVAQLQSIATAACIAAVPL